MFKRQADLRLAVMVAMAAAAAGCHTKGRSVAMPEQTVRAGLIEKVQSEMPQRFSANFSALNEVNLAFKTAGLIEQILQVGGADGHMRVVQPGDKVPEGAVLAQVRRIDYQQKVDSAGEQLRQAQAQLAEAESVLQHADLDYTRTNNLYRQASLIKPEYDRAKAQLDSARAQVEASKAAVANAAVNLSEAKISLGDTSLKAPFSGWVTARNVDVGSMVSAAVVGFSLMDTHVVKADFGIPDITLRSVRVGQRIGVDVEALGHPVTGVVHTISPGADPKTHVFTVEVYIRNANEQLRPGMLGTVALVSGRAATHTIVPLSAVVRDPGNPNGFAIYRLEERGDKTYARAQAIKLGETFGNSIEIMSGAAAGQRVVVLGAELLRNGQEVRVLP